MDNGSSGFHSQPVHEDRAAIITDERARGASRPWSIVHCPLSIVLLLLLSFGAVSCDGWKQKLYKPRFKTRCEILEQRCRFINLGDPGEVCVRVDLLRTEDAAPLRSHPVCSGKVPTNGEIWERVSFPADPFIHCMGDDLKGNFVKRCSVKITELSRTAE